MIEPTWKSEDGRVTLYLGDCVTVMRSFPDCLSIDAVVTDPPYLTDDAQVPIRGNGVAECECETASVGNPWGYSLEWMSEIPGVAHWIVYANYRMLGGVCSALELENKLSAVFVWRKSNAPRMTRPVPRLDCEFVIWARSNKATCGDMGKFDSLVLDVPMPQAGCFAAERILDPGSGKAAHPCQKPLAVVAPFVERLPIRSVIDPFMGTGTTGVACVKAGKAFLGIESDPGYFAIAKKRIQDALCEGEDKLPFKKDGLFAALA